MIVVTRRPQKLAGTIKVPGDKSITHRAMLIGALARGKTRIEGFLKADDTWATVRCLEALGVKITEKPGYLLLEGRNMVLKKPERALDAQNSGTTARLLLGLLAGQPFEATLKGDESLNKRPMMRIITPLTLMGASFHHSAARLPLQIKGGKLKAITYSSPQASAQVKSAVLLAALYAGQTTTFEEPFLSRNHTELMLKSFGADLKQRGSKVFLKGGSALQGSLVKVPGDLSAAAFFMVAAAIVPGAAVSIKEVGINPTRSGIVEVLLKMGADVRLENKKYWGAEPVADITVCNGPRLRAVIIDKSMIPRVIDEIPALCVAAAVAAGTTVIEGAAELKLKESDRLAVVAKELTRLQADIRATGESLTINGRSKLQGAEVFSHHDHRMAMALAIAGLVAGGETAVHQAEAVSVSYPGFMQDLRSLTLQ